MERREIVFVGGHDGGDPELAGLFSKIGKKLKSVIKKVAPIAAGFIPGVGGVISTAISAKMDSDAQKKAQKKAAQEAAAAAGIPYSDALLQPGAFDVPRQESTLIPGVSNTVLFAGGAALALIVILSMQRGRR